MTVKAVEEYKPEGWETAVSSAVGVGALFLRAWVGTLAWRWFVVPLGVPAVGFWWMFAALWTVTGLVRSYPHNAKATSESDFWAGVGAVVVSPLIILSVLAIVHGVTA